MASSDEEFLLLETSMALKLLKGAKREGNMRQARKQLIPEVLEAKSAAKAARLACPARIIINGDEVKSRILGSSR
ncbi:hypothetical protein ElyMa_000755200 [Elysia marginata]|uniref:Uncharacterized protein n=1 Tax=Elysia marginata TaxID=1093978 RepID=A0AAV4GPN5_9GAST|nr:hypothetical protein ElyMa_000755200 [Elysia marginata]